MPGSWKGWLPSSRSHVYEHGRDGGRQSCRSRGRMVWTGRSRGRKSRANESGSQNKATLGVRGSTVPVVEGNNGVKSRWTANLTTCSEFTAVAGGAMPWSECMFKASSDGPLNAKFQEYRRSRGYPSWFTVTTGPKGSYREAVIMQFLDRHLEPWHEGRR